LGSSSDCQNKSPSPIHKDSRLDCFQFPLENSGTSDSSCLQNSEECVNFLFSGLSFGDVVSGNKSVQQNPSPLFQLDFSSSNDYIDSYFGSFPSYSKQAPQESSLPVGMSQHHSHCLTNGPVLIDQNRYNIQPRYAGIGVPSSFAPQIPATYNNFQRFDPPPEAMAYGSHYHSHNQSYQRCFTQPFY
jgi:hypothetical protein